MKGDVLQILILSVKYYCHSKPTKEAYAVNNIVTTFLIALKLCNWMLFKRTVHKCWMFSEWLVYWLVCCHGNSGAAAHKVAEKRICREAVSRSPASYTPAIL